MNYFLRLSIIALSFFIIVHSSYAGWDDLELKDEALIRAIKPGKKFREQNNFNLYFSYQTSLYWGDTKIEENDREYLLNLTEQLTPSSHSINHLFVKIFCIYEDRKGKQHYIDSIVLAKFYGFKKAVGLSHYIGLSVTHKSMDEDFHSKRHIDFSSSTGKKIIKKTSVSDRAIAMLLHSGQKTKFGHSEDRFFKLEANSKAIEKKGDKYNNSIFQQLINKKVDLKKINQVICFGVKFFSRYDACDDCQQLIVNELRKDKGLRREFVGSLKGLGLKSVVEKDVPFIPIYYSGRPYSGIDYAFYSDGIKYLSLESAKRTSSIYFVRTTTQKRVFPQQSYQTDDGKIDLSLDYLQGCMFSNIRTLYTE
jgi:hypothetical protein